MSIVPCCIPPFGCVDVEYDECRDGREIYIDYIIAWQYPNCEAVHAANFAQSYCADTVVRPCCIGFECEILNRSACESRRGMWFSGSQVCTPGFCGGPPLFACCIDEYCTLELPSVCEAAGGEVLNRNTCNDQICNKLTCCTCDQCIRGLERDCRSRYRRINPVPCGSSTDRCLSTQTRKSDFELGNLSRPCGFANVHPRRVGPGTKFKGTTSNKTNANDYPGCYYYAAKFIKRVTRTKFSPFICNKWYRTQMTKGPLQGKIRRTAYVQKVASRLFRWLVKYHPHCNYMPEPS